MSRRARRRLSVIATDNAGASAEGTRDAALRAVALCWFQQYRDSFVPQGLDESLSDFEVTVLAGRAANRMRLERHVVRESGLPRALLCIGHGPDSDDTTPRLVGSDGRPLFERGTYLHLRNEVLFLVACNSERILRDMIECRTPPAAALVFRDVVFSPADAAVRADFQRTVFGAIEDWLVGRITFYAIKDRAQDASPKSFAARYTLKAMTIWPDGCPLTAVDFFEGR